MTDTDVVVIGGGPAGMMSATSAGDAGASVILLDHNEKLGKKLFITGHGRCNVTNASERHVYEKNFFRNGRFMRSAFAAFGPKETVKFLENNGVPTKTEASGRVFPRSDKSSDVIIAFKKALAKAHVDVRLNSQVESVSKRNEVFAVRTNDKEFHARAVIIATGGVSYPATGSTGSGFSFAASLGHGLVPLAPGLCGIISSTDLKALQGLTAKDVLGTLYVDNKRVSEERGDLMFTHNGLSGPVAMRLSCYLPADTPAGAAEIRINLRPRFSDEETTTLLRDAVADTPNRDVLTIMQDLLPKRLAAAVAGQAGIAAGRKGNQLTKQERSRLVQAMRAFTVPVLGTRPIEEAIVTVGGVPVKEINPSTMESRLVPGLYFAGEVMDVSALTGGYNIQQAISSGWVAGRQAAEHALDAPQGRISLSDS